MADDAVAKGDISLPQDVVRFRINRYTILLSRGRKGTIRLCDEPAIVEALRVGLRTYLTSHKREYP